MSPHISLKFYSLFPCTRTNDGAWVGNKCTAMDESEWASHGCVVEFPTGNCAGLGCKVPGGSTGSGLTSLGSVKALTGYHQCHVTCPTEGGAFAVTATGG